MYILIELVPEVDGSGLVFVCILLIVLALLIGAELSMSWILAPIGLTMALMESANWWRSRDHSCQRENRLLFT